MAELPTGTVTFLFTDLAGSTRLWEEHPEAMRDALARHDEIVRSAIESRGGQIVKTTGDGVHAAFPTAHDAIDAAVDAQRLLVDEHWAETGPLAVRMGIHTGETQERDGDYYGTAVNRAARLMAVAHGGQVLCSRATVEVAGAAFAFRSLGGHRLRDLGAPQEIFQVGDGSFPPLRSVDVVPTNLPILLTELIGRSEEVERIVALVERERLVTLTGVGGVGKTRLALAVAASSASSFPDGVWFVELAPAGSGEEVVRAAAVAMGAAATDRVGLAEHLSDRRVLLVLDNCEHVLSHAAALAESILVAGPEAVIVATSREPLGVDGETVRGVRSLAVPDPDAESAEVAAAAAVRLFVERASSATDTFALNDANAAAVVAICAQLDGIPLAIELAASRVRAMPPEEIARRLGERFRLLSAGRGAQERHRTLQAAVSWSHDLLGETERRVFRRLAVFPASFELDAAEAVAGDPETDVIDALVRLVDQSLVQYDATSGRYRLLETLRQYAADRLADAGETDLARDRHTRFYVALAAEHASPGEFLSTATMQRLNAEMDNLQAVAERLAAHEQWGDLLGLGRHLFEFTYFCAVVEGCRWYRDALDHDADLDAQERVDALGEFDMLQAFAGAPDFGPSITLADASGLMHSPWAWEARFSSLNAGDDPPGARAAAETALAVAEDRHNHFATMAALMALACGVATLGELAESERLGTELLRQACQTQNPTALAWAVVGAAGSYITARVDPDFSGGMRILEANAVEPDPSQPTLAVWLLRIWGLAHLGLGRADLAVPLLTRSLRLADQRYPGVLKSAALALAVALGEAGHPTLAVQLGGYSGGHFATHTMRDFSHTWLQPRLAAIEDALDPAERIAALDAGARLDRRGFMRLLAVAEHSVDSQGTPR
jgi:predicted ATPase/class 3 adenylate cyclase